MTTYTRKELHDKRAKLIGEIAQLEKQARELHNKLAYVESSIRIL
jgi:vacuolar-type H+-ATPase subunit D/Vma8